MKKSIKISPQQAKAFVVHQQLLSPAVNAKGKAGVLQVFEQLGYVQIDTISVVQRAHHHVIWSRIPDYQKSHLQQLEEDDRLIFEYWAHAAAYLPMRDYRFSLIRKAQIRAGKGHWFKRNPKVMKKVLERFKTDGPLMARDFKKESLKSDIPWMQHPTNQAIRQLYMEGTLMVSGRKGFQKIYDLTENVLPSHVQIDPPSRIEFLEYLIERDLRAHGWVRAQDFGHLITNIQKDLKNILAQKVEEGQIVAIPIKGLPDEMYYAAKPHLENFLQQKTRRKTFHLLSPFDNLLIQRKRMKALFDFDYTIECYVTAAKRKVGYFNLPMLWGTTFVGQVDLKADRKTKVLLVKNLVWEQSFKNPEKAFSPFRKALQQFAIFNQCDQIDANKDLIVQFPALFG